MRELLVDVLAHGGCYNILTANSASRALQQSKEFTGEIHLLLTGLQMPGMSGIELATLMIIDRPELTVLIISGFPDEAIGLNEQWHFLRKPFDASQLRALVTELMYPG